MTTPVLHAIDATINTATFSDTIVLTSLDTTNVLISGAAPAADQFLGADGLGVLGWQDIPLALETPTALYFAAHPQNYNAAAFGYINFVDPANYNTIGSTWNGGLQVINLPINQTFEVEFKAMVTASASTVRFTIEWDGTDVAEFITGPGSDNGSCKAIMAISGVGNQDFRIGVDRVGADATAKNNYSAISTQVIIRRIV